MSTQYHGGPAALPVSPIRCLRHHVWMAACGDCRAAHAPRAAVRPNASRRPDRAIDGEGG